MTTQQQDSDNRICLVIQNQANTSTMANRVQMEIVDFFMDDESLDQIEST